MFERDETTGKIDFSHNPFSMPQGGLKALQEQDPLTIKAWQYDLVCNGVELSSGAIRNHLPEVMYRAFEIAGYDTSVVDEKFPAMINAFRFGAPPHGGIAPGIDRMVMLIADEPNIREVILFPMNGKAEDLMMAAPSDVDDAALTELHIRRAPVPKAESARHPVGCPQNARQQQHRAGLVHGAKRQWNAVQKHGDPQNKLCPDKQDRQRAGPRLAAWRRARSASVITARTASAAIQR